MASALSRLDEILIKADLISLTRKLEIQDFSGEGQYLKHYSIDQLTKSLGTPEDDAENTLTARLLLLLEGAPLVGAAVFSELVGEVLAAYWRDYEDHKESFVPAFLSNDILRLWRTFCVNYEARTQRDPQPKKSKGKLQNYKLKHSRMLTCYSVLLLLLFYHQKNGTVAPDIAMTIMRKTPTERLEWLLEQNECDSAHSTICQLLERYETFLQITHVPEPDLVASFGNRDFAHERFAEASLFGDSMFVALEKIGAGSRLYRLLVV